MRKDVVDRVNELFEAAKDLQSLEEIKPHCEQFNEWISTNTNYKNSSLGTILSNAGLHQKFNSLPLEQNKNAELVQKYDFQDKTKVTGNELKHYAVLLCGLSKEDWDNRNATTRVTDSLTNTDADGNTGIELDPDTYLEATATLLASESPHELAVGLIAATGRRPHEILARGEFTPIEGQKFKVDFKGQGKKRSEKPVFKISTLFPASYIIERLARLREDASIKDLLKQVAIEFPDDIGAQNKSIEDKRGNSLRRIVQEYFGGKGSKEPLLNFRLGKEQNDCKALRAACACLVTKRDCKGSDGAKIYFAALFLGHITPGVAIADTDLMHIATTLCYSDYYITKPVRFTDEPPKKLSSARDAEIDLEAIRKLQEKLEAPNPQSVINQLIESQRLVSQLEEQVRQLEINNNQLAQANNQLAQANNQLQEEKNAMETTAMETTAPQPQTVTLNVTELDSWLEAKITEFVNKAIEMVAIAPATPATPATTSTPATSVRVATSKEDTDWQTKTDAEVWASKTPLAALEKIRRSFLAICNYNATVAIEDADRLAITNQALRELSGCNGLLVGDWVRGHRDEVISHNGKFGMENKKDPSNPASYANKGKDTDKILLLVNEEFLSGEGFKAGRN